MSPQARYNREVRQCPEVRQVEAEKQHDRRGNDDYRKRAAAYARTWRKAQKQKS